MSGTESAGAHSALISRRAFVGAVAAGIAGLGGLRITAGSRYRVARIQSADPYGGTMSALAASGEFPDVSGRTVAIKPNLVAARPADGGVTTDPHAVRAVADWALAGGAAEVIIVEGGRDGAPFAACGYGIFDQYDPRVRLLDITAEPVTLAVAPPASGVPAAFRGVYLPSALLQPEVVLVSVAKLKTHAESMATLALKNLFGLAARTPYADPTGRPLPLFLLHDRGLGQSIADVARIRPIDFAVIEGVWGLEGNGPTDTTGGSRVEADVIIAGRNALAADLAALETIGVPADTVPHVQYAALNGLGPADMSGVDLVGDAVDVLPFIHPTAPPPKIWHPLVFPGVFSPAEGHTATIVWRIGENARVQVQVLRTNDRVPQQAVVRTLRAWSDVTAGTYSLQWDGRDETGGLVLPAPYGIRVQARRPSGSPIAAAVNWVVAA